ncbi:MAG: PAS domain-containing protein [Fibrobacterota bacterium]
MSDIFSYFRNAMDTAPIPWWEWDVNKNRVSFNSLKVTMIGYDMRDFRNVGYEAFTELLHPDDYEDTMEAMRRFLSGAVSLYTTDYRILGADGRYRWYMDRGTWADDRPGVLRGVVLNLGEHLNDSRRLSELKLVLASRRREGYPVTVCVQCQRIRLDESSWIRFSPDVVNRDMNLALSHTICPDCLPRLYPDLYGYNGQQSPSVDEKEKE